MLVDVPIGKCFEDAGPSENYHVVTTTLPLPFATATPGKGRPREYYLNGIAASTSGYDSREDPLSSYPSVLKRSTMRSLTSRPRDNAQRVSTACSALSQHGPVENDGPRYIAKNAEGLCALQPIPPLLSPTHHRRSC